MTIQELLPILACPTCHGDLTLDGDPKKPSGLICPACHCVYPIREEIPILLATEARPLPPTQTTTEA